MVAYTHRQIDRNVGDTIPANPATPAADVRSRAGLASATTELGRHRTNVVR